MAMLRIDLASSPPADGPLCDHCNGRTQLTGIESHPRLAYTDLRTYECRACDTVQTLAAPHPRASVNAIVVVGRPADSAP